MRRPSATARWPACAPRRCRRRTASRPKRRICGTRSRPTAPRQPLLRELASLLWAEHQIDTADPGVLEARLKPLTAPDNAWHSLAQEQLAVLDLRQGKKDAAKTDFAGGRAGRYRPDGVRGRAAALLAQLGG